jgi:Ca-activated chloride channel family protein
MLLKSVLGVLFLLQFTLSVDVDLVVFNVTALEGGKPVEGLTEKDFRIYEDGREEKIKIFQPENTPSTVGLVIDNSASMANKRRDVVAAASSFVSNNNPLDETFIVNFNSRVWLGLPASKAFTSDRSELHATLTQTRAEGTTALYDALTLALKHLKDGSRQRKALVLLSDGGDNASDTKLDDVLLLAQQSSATIYCIGIYDSFQKDRNPGALKKIAKVTGGEAFFPTSPAAVQAVWPRIAGRSKVNIRLDIYPLIRRMTAVSQSQNYSSQARKLLDVRSRPGYVAGK